MPGDSIDPGAAVCGECGEPVDDATVIDHLILHAYAAIVSGEWATAEWPDGEPVLEPV